MIDQATLEKVHTLLLDGRFSLDFDAEKDIIKHNLNLSKDMILECLREGKIFAGIELYPEDKNRHNRFYCIHKYSIVSSKLMLIGFLILNGILIIHVCPINKGSKEGKVYYGL